MKINVEKPVEIKFQLTVTEEELQLIADCLGKTNETAFSKNRFYSSHVQDGYKRVVVLYHEVSDFLDAM